MNIMNHLTYFCSLCKSLYNSYICNNCYTKLIYSSNRICVICEHTECKCSFKTSTLFEYNDFLRNIIFKFKYYDEIHIIEFFGKYLSTYIKQKIHNYLSYKLVYIPSSTMQTLWRGYNQSLEICKSIAYFTNQSVMINLLYKNSYTTQKNNNKKQRHVNARSIEIDLKKYDSNCNYIIVDDIIGSGATVLRAVSLLKSSTNQIHVVAIAKS